MINKFSKVSKSTTMSPSPSIIHNYIAKSTNKTFTSAAMCSEVLEVPMGLEVSPVCLE